MTIGPIIIWLAIGILLAYEGYALANRRRGDTISEIILATSLKRPLIPFVLGMLAGHWFWQMQCPLGAP